MRLLQIVLVCALATSAIVVAVEKLRFDNHRVYNIDIQNAEQLKTLQQLELNSDGLRFWESPVKTNSRINVVATPEKVAEFQEIIDNLNLDAKVTIENLQALIDEEKRPQQSRAIGIDWVAYYTLDEIYAWLDELLLEFPEILTPLVGGTSFEGRPIRGVKMSYKTGNPGIFLDSNIHAREWITSATSTYILNEFLTSTDSDIRRLAEDYDWYYFPVINPDGFVYSHEVDRQWRKTRSRHSILCYGADPNRNWGFNFMEGGASSIPCTDTFAGPYAFSEIETQTLSNYYSSIADKITLYLSFHSYGQYLLIPYGDQRGARPENYDDMMVIGNAVRDTLLSFENVLYDVGTAYDVLYTASGISMDWAMGTMKTPLAYTYEFRDKGNFGFVLPPAQIIPNAVEVLASLVTMIDRSVALGYFAREAVTP